jgi:hypothetical protein
VGARGQARAKRALGVVVALASAVLVAGCQYLLDPSLTDPDAFDAPKAIATYASGTASLTIGADPTIDLDELSAAALYEDWWGGEATWSSGDGWYLRVFGATSGGGVFGSSASVTLDRVVDGRHWTTYDGSRCIVTIDAADAKALRGSATCKGMRWSDAISGLGAGLEPRYIEGEDAFDAEIRFEALPQSATPA